MAVGEMFPYKFQVYQNGELLAQFGEPVEVIKLLKFLGGFMEFEVLIPQAQRLVSATSMPIEFEPWQSTSCIHSEPCSSSTAHSQPHFAVSADLTIPAAREGKRGKKRRKRFMNTICKKQLWDAAKTYAQNHPEVNRKAVENYNKNHPEVNQRVVKNYNRNQPEVNQRAVKK
ncbi:hypothetical protein AVEN_181133-1 [Araneus ventricosus]|uniref:Uncharacterized protein n=1 Tax=Araneus ventricosus TaxID=182803 RepID=A0A4Y2HL13_ARAVE|nr:hypothetical protein AVEN_181133-1 [Araneus ventricosus]